MTYYVDDAYRIIFCLLIIKHGAMRFDRDIDAARILANNYKVTIHTNIVAANGNSLYVSDMNSNSKKGVHESDRCIPLLLQMCGSWCELAIGNEVGAWV